MGKSVLIYQGLILEQRNEYTNNYIAELLKNYKKLPLWILQSLYQKVGTEKVLSNVKITKYKAI